MQFPVAGLEIDDPAIVKVCVDLLFAQIRANLWGEPTRRQRVLIEPRWRNNPSIRGAAR